MLQRSVTIAGTGAHHPARCVPNAELDTRYGAGTGAWLEANLAIRQRYWMADGERTSDLCLPAAQQALAKYLVDKASRHTILTICTPAHMICNRKPNPIYVWLRNPPLSDDITHARRTVRALDGVRALPPKT